MDFVTSRHSKPWSHDSIGSLEAYLIDSLNSIFLKSRPNDKVTCTLANSPSKTLQQKIKKINTSPRLLNIERIKCWNGYIKQKLLQHSRIYPMKKTNKADNSDEAGLIVSFWKSIRQHLLKMQRIAPQAAFQSYLD